MASYSNTCNGSGGDHYTLHIDVTQNSQNVANNTSNVTVTMWAQSDSPSYGAYNNGGGCSYSLSVDGAVRASSSSASMDFRNRSRVNMATWTGNISHASNGTKTLNVSGSFSFSGSSYLSGGSCSGSMTLTTIARESSVSISSKDIKLGTKATITITRADSGFTHTLIYAYTDSKGTRRTEEIMKTGTATSVSWTPSINIADNITKSQTVSGTLTCYTYRSDKKTLIGSKNVNNVILRVPVDSNTRPSFTEDPVPVTDGASVNYYNKFNVFLKGKSMPLFSAKFSGKHGATVQSFKLTLENFEYNAANINPTNGTASIKTYELKSAGTLTAKMKLTDSRGITLEKNQTITSINYSEPTFVTATAIRNSTNQKLVDLKVVARGTAISTGDKNTLSCTYCYKKDTDTSYSSETNMFTPTVIASNTTEYSGTKQLTLDANSIYNIRYKLTDTAGVTVTREITVGTEFVTMDFYHDGTGIAFGKVSTKPNVMAVNMNAYFSTAADEIGDATKTNGQGVYLEKSGKIIVAGSEAVPLAFNVFSGSSYSYAVEVKPYTGGLTVGGVKLFHAKGDTMSTSGTVGGAITNSKKSVLFKIPIGKPAVQGATASITSLKLSVRQNGGYPVGSASGTVAVTGYTATFSGDDCSINVSYVASEALPNSINNAPCGVSYEATIKFS